MRVPTMYTYLQVSGFAPDILVILKFRLFLSPEGTLGAFALDILVILKSCQSAIWVVSG